MIRLAIAAALLASTAAFVPAEAKTMKDCAADWQVLKTTGTTAGQKYKDFSKSCMSGAAVAPVVAPAVAAAAPAVVAPAPAKVLASVKPVVAPAAVAAVVAKPVAAVPAKPAPIVVAAAKPAPAIADVAEPNLAANQLAPIVPTMAAPAGVTFPKAINAQYASESAGKARLHTCVDAYHVAKSANSLGGLKWIQQGGGYYSLCNAALKS